jgi:sarcosine oxidase subunit alpha
LKKEILKSSRRNIVECIEDFGIPMLLSHTVVDVKGKERLEGVLIAEVDENKKPVKGREEFITCDTLLLSVGLLPENDIPKKAGIKISKASGGPEVDESLQTSVEGVFACGNLLHVYDWVDDAVLESFNTGRNAASYIKEERVDRKNIELIAEQGIRYTVPGYISIHNAGEFIDIKLRVEEAFENCFISIYFDHELGTRARKSAVSPGDMEFIRLNKDILIKYADCNKIYARIEKE